MINFVISGTIGGEYDFPTELFNGYCYEGWGNAWCIIDGVHAKYIPAQAFIDKPERLSEVNILMAEFGQQELHQLAYDRDVFNIATESGAGFDIDREDNIEKKLDFIERLDRCALLLSTTHGGKEYLSMFTTTPVLDIPLPMDLKRFQPRIIEKYKKFTVCLGEFIESCYDDRPLQLLCTAVAKSLNIKIVGSIGPQSRNFSASDLNKLGFGIAVNGHASIYLQPHKGLPEMSNDYLAKSHVSMMIGQRSTFGRFIYVSWAIGVPCIATRYQCQEKMCPELTVSIEEVDKIKYLLRRLKTDKTFYQSCVKMGLSNTRKYLAKEVVALRIVNEILPFYYGCF